DPQPGVWTALRQYAGGRAAWFSAFRAGELCVILLSALAVATGKLLTGRRTNCPMTASHPCMNCMMTDRPASDIFRTVLKHNVVIAVRSPRRPKPHSEAFGVFAF